MTKYYESWASLHNDALLLSSNDIPTAQTRLGQMVIVLGGGKANRQWSEVPLLGNLGTPGCPHAIVVGLLSS